MDVATSDVVVVVTDVVVVCDSVVSIATSVVVVAVVVVAVVVVDVCVVDVAVLVAVVVRGFTPSEVHRDETLAGPRARRWAVLNSGHTPTCLTLRGARGTTMMVGGTPTVVVDVDVKTVDVSVVRSVAVVMVTVVDVVLSVDVLVAVSVLVKDRT